MFKVIVAGSRNFTDYDLLTQKLDTLLQNVTDEIEIVSGTASGADKLGERYAEKRCLSVKRFPADWDKHGKRAGYLRNAEMAKYADALVAFWDGKSKGTEHMINLAQENNLRIKRVMF